MRTAFRAIARTPGLTLVVVLSLGLGIGANAAVFTVINAVLLRQLPVREPAQLVEPRSRYPGEPAMNFFSWPSHFAGARTLSDVAGVGPARLHISYEASQPRTASERPAPEAAQPPGGGLATEIVNGDYVTGNLFPMLGMQPALGRFIGPDDEAGEAVVVIGWELWRSRFARDRGVVGRRIGVYGVPATVIGVAPRGFDGLYVNAGRPADVWVPAGMVRLMPAGSAPPGVQIIARLKRGVRVEEAEAELRVLDRVRIEGMVERDPQWLKAVLEVTPAGGGFAFLSDRFGGQLIALMAIVALVLLVACTNVASLLAARAVSRERELAVCVALGATRARLVRQALAESLLLASAAAVVGLWVSYFGARAIVASWPVDGRSGIDRYDVAVAPDVTVLAFTVLLALAVAVLAGLASSGSVRLQADRRFGSVRLQPDGWLGRLFGGVRLQADRVGLATLLQANSTLGLPSPRRRFGQALVISQVAISVVLLTGAVLFARHVSDLRTRDLGFEPRGVVRVSLDASQSGLQPEPLFQSYQNLLARVREVPGVRAAALAAVTPIQRGEALQFVAVDGFVEEESARRRVSLNWVGPGYFEALGASLVAGRDFLESDSGGPRVAIVNQRFARYYFGDAAAIGRRFTMERSSEIYEIVGVVADMKYASLHDPAPRTVFLSALQEERGRIHQFVLSADAAAVASVRALAGTVLPSVPVAVVPLEDQLNASIVLERQMAGLSSALGLVAAVLAGLGLYGLLAFTVAWRVPEIGVRMALGATASDVVRMVLSSAFRPLGLGLVLGVALAWWVSQVGGSVVPVGGGVVVPVVFAGFGILVVGLLAAWLPSRRAARIAPVDALRRA